jgi:7-cyano-7-deazaguanine synthase
MADKAIVLLSGGLDSTTLLYYAKDQGYEADCLIFHYGQRHTKEIQRAVKIAEHTQSAYHMVRFAMPWKGSSLIEAQEPIPSHQKIETETIPSTYVPARNIIFLSFAASFAEAVNARAIFIGANAVDYSGYPDCRPDFMRAYQEVLRQGLKTGVEGRPIQLAAPLIDKTKAEIIRMGLRLGVPYERTWSCYQGGEQPCGQCDSCVLRAKGFSILGEKDPLIA